MGSGGALKIVFFMRYYSYIAHYEETLRELCEKGHHVHFAFNNRHNKPFDAAKMEQLFSSIPNISYDFFPDATRGWIWSVYAEWVRRTIDFLRYCHPDYRSAPKLRKRFEKKLPGMHRFLFKRLFLKLAGEDKWIALFKKMETIIPVPATAMDYLQKLSPDLVLFTPLMDSNTGFIDYAKAARKLGIRSAICVASWDNLTNKGLIQAETDRILVWNEFQKEEALKYHFVSPDKVAVTGAQTFDKWFEKRPSTTQEAFLKKIGLDGCRKFIVYACSSRFIAEYEVDFVRKWATELRNSDFFKEYGLLVRPHPANIGQWDDVTLADIPGVSVYPRWKGIPYPFTEEDKADYFHSLHFGSALVGINTSAMIEAGIQIKPVFTVLAEEFKTTQEGTLHFSHVRDHGLLSVAKDLADHRAQLQDVLSSEGVGERIRAFITRFVRPHGWGSKATPYVVGVLEALGKEPAPKKMPAYTPIHVLFMRCALLPVLAVFFVAMHVSVIKKAVLRFCHKSLKRIKDLIKRGFNFLRVKVLRIPL